jgi:hypothetical protein
VRPSAQRTVTRQPCEHASPKVSTGMASLVLGLDILEQKENTQPSESREAIVKPRAVVEPDKRSAWLRKLDEEYPYQVVLPRQQLTDDSEILDFLLAHVGWFDMYVEDDYAAFVRYCFEDPLDADIFRARFEPKIEHLKLTG